MANINLITLLKALKKKTCSKINFHLSSVMIGTILAHQQHYWVSTIQTSNRKMIRWQQKKGESHAIKIKQRLNSLKIQMLRKIPSAIIVNIQSGDNLIAKKQWQLHTTAKLSYSSMLSYFKIKRHNENFILSFKVIIMEVCSDILKKFNNV